MSLKFTAGQGGRCQTATSPTGRGTSDYTISCWIKLTARTDQSVFMQVQDGSHGFQGITQLVVSSNSYGSYESLTNHQFSTIVSLNTWHHLVVRRSSGTGSGWLDGVQDLANFATSVNWGAFQLTVGGNLNGSANFTGMITDTAVWTTALSDSTIAEIYNNTYLASSYAPDYVYWKLDQTTGTPATSDSGLADQVDSNHLTIVSSSGMSWQNDSPGLIAAPKSSNWRVHKNSVIFDNGLALKRNQTGVTG